MKTPVETENHEYTMLNDCPVFLPKIEILPLLNDAHKPGLFPVASIVNTVSITSPLLGPAGPFAATINCSGAALFLITMLDDAPNAACHGQDARGN